MNRLAERLLVSELSKKTLRLLNRSPIIIEKGTPYERPETPYFQDATEPATESVRVVISNDLRHGSFYGDSDHWHRSEVCVIPSVSFYTLLAGLETDNTVTMEVLATISEIDMAWGADCENPHETVTHKEEPVLIEIGISEDTKTVTINLLRRKSNEFVPYATLRRSETGSG